MKVGLHGLAILFTVHVFSVTGLGLDLGKCGLNRYSFLITSYHQRPLQRVFLTRHYYANAYYCKRWPRDCLIFYPIFLKDSDPKILIINLYLMQF